MAAPMLATIVAPAPAPVNPQQRPARAARPHADGEGNGVCPGCGRSEYTTYEGFTTCCRRWPLIGRAQGAH